MASPDRLCHAHHSLLPNFPIFWNWFAVSERVFVCGCPRGSRCLFPFFSHLLSTGKKRASNGDLHTESRQSLSCSLRDMGDPTSLAQDVLPVAQKKMSQKPVRSGLNILGPHNFWSLVAKLLGQLSLFAECHQYMRMV